MTSHKDFQGGVINHGDFLEGYCFQVHTKNNENKEIVWELCSNNKVNKINKLTNFFPKKLLKKF